LRSVGIASDLVSVVLNHDPEDLKTGAILKDAIKNPEQRAAIVNGLRVDAQRLGHTELGTLADLLESGASLTAILKQASDMEDEQRQRFLSVAGRVGYSREQVLAE